VKLGKLGKKLKREAIANPKKAAVLGLVTLVALYFWVPLVLGWTKNDSPAAPPDAVAATSAETAAMPGAMPTSEPNVARPSWQQVAEWMRNDPRTKPAPPLQLARDPFESAKSAAETVETEAAVETAAAPALTPEAVGLVLTGTIIGPNSRLAQIGGKPYSVGQMIEASKDKALGAAAFKLIEVQPRRAVLQLGTQRFELTMPQPGDSEKIEIK
jgi:hypothetical protein